MNSTFIRVSLLASVLALQGCNSKDDTPPSIGVFLDSPVQFIDYKTKNSAGNITRMDQTNAAGEYEYTEGETVTFSIGTLEFPPVEASGVVTPLDIANTDNPNDTKAVNMIRLLQTLDSDGDPSNGITITEKAKDTASDIVVADPEVNVFELTEAEFVASVQTLVENGGQDEQVTELVSIEAAVDHFEETLAENDVAFDPVDDTAPVITVLGDNPAVVTQDDSYVDAGASARDDVDGVVLVTTTGTVDTSKVGAYTITYSVSDVAGNTAQTTRTVNVVAPDTIAPEITLIGESTITITQNASYTDAGATATDNVDTNVTVITSGTVDTSTIGSYTLTYSATDAAGNAANEVTRTVNVVAVVVIDNTAPVITLSGASEVTINQGDNYTDAGATASDNVDTSVTVTVTGSVDTSVAGTYTLTYSAKDAANNAATPVTRTITVVEPVIEEPVYSLQGSWQLPPEVTLHFLPDGRYLATQWAEPDAYDQGFEYGTYVASETEITFTTRQNHAGDILTCNQDKGVNCTGENGADKGVWGYSLDENELSISPQGENFTEVLDRIQFDRSTNEFEGLWESLEAKEFVFFAGGNFIYVDYLSESGSDETIMDIGFYEATGNTSGDYDEIALTSNITYDSQGRNVCNDCDGSYYFDVVNKQFVVIDLEGGDNGAAGRGYFNDVYADVPADTARLVAQKDYDSDFYAYGNFALESEDDYRTHIETPNLGQPVDIDGDSISVSFTIDDSSSLVKESDADGSLQTRLYAYYRVPNSDDAVSVSLRLRNYGGSPSGKYVISRCINGDCDNEVYIEGSLSGFAESFTGNHEMSIVWDDANQSFVFTIDGQSASVAISEYTQDPLVVNAGGHAFNTDEYVGIRFTADVYDIQASGASGYLAIDVDEVTLNGELYDDFAGGLIDDQKWNYRSEER